MTNTNISYDDKVLKKIIGAAAEGVPGVLGPSSGFLAGLRDAFVPEAEVDITRGITVTVDGAAVDAEVLITTEENRDMLWIMDEVKRRVQEAIAAQTDLHARNLRVEIVDTETPEAYAERFCANCAKDEA